MEVASSRAEVAASVFREARLHQHGCRGCRNMWQGVVVVEERHSKACRTRITELLKQDEACQGAAQAAEDRKMRYRDLLVDTPSGDAPIVEPAEPQEPEAKRSRPSETAIEEPQAICDAEIPMGELDLEGDQQVDEPNQSAGGPKSRKS